MKSTQMSRAEGKPGIDAPEEDPQPLTAPGGPSMKSTQMSRAGDKPEIDAPEDPQPPTPTTAPGGPSMKSTQMSRADGKPEINAPAREEDPQPPTPTTAPGGPSIKSTQMSRAEGKEGIAVSSSTESPSVGSAQPIIVQVPTQSKKSWLTWLKEKVFGKPKLSVYVAASPEEVYMLSKRSNQRIAEKSKKVSPASTQTKSNSVSIDASGKKIAEKMTHDATYGPILTGSPTVAGVTRPKAKGQGRS